MERRIGRKRYKIWAMDLETHADDESVQLEETGVWMGCFIDHDSKMDDEQSYFYDLDSFLDRLEELTGAKRTKKKRPCVNHMVYIFNLSFEWSFLLPVLLERGFQWTNKVRKDDEMVFSSVTNKTCSSVWTATLKFSKNGGIVVFKDIGKIFPCGRLRDIAKSFELPTQKGDIDYRINRRHGWVVTKEEKEYNFKDCRIILDIIQKMADREDKEFFSCVSAASYTLKKMLRETYPRSFNPRATYRKDYPCLPTEVNEFLRRSVEGGITYVVPEYQFKELKNIAHIDIHQAHPASMTGKGGRKGLPEGIREPDGRFPYGEPVYGLGKPNPHPWKMACIHCKISYSGVILHSKVQLIGIDMVSDYDIVLWDFELLLMKKCYIDFKVTYIDYYEFKTKRLPFAGYLMENYEKRLVAKKKKDAFGTMYYKTLNNSAYGKFLERGHDSDFENYVTENGLLDSHIIPHTEVDSNATYTYLGIGSATAAWTRVRLVGTALYLSNMTGKNIVYFDTDSIFYLSTPETDERANRLNLKDELGGWSFEEFILEGQFTAPKRYKLLLEKRNDYGENVVDVKAAGISSLPGINTELLEDEQGKPFVKARSMEWSQINLVDGVYAAHSKHRVKGGTLILDTEKSLQVQPKYMSIYKHNVK